MNRMYRLFAVSFLLGCVLMLGPFITLMCAAQTPDVAAGSRHVDETVWVIPIKGTIDLGLAEFVRRVVPEAESQGAALLLLEINTFGGRVDAATEIRDIILATHLRTVAYVSERAISAGALVALAADQLVMAPGASIGAAEPRPLDAKTVSYVRSEFEATAKQGGRDPNVAGAMVDAAVEIEGLVRRGEILTLPAYTAQQIGFSDHVAKDRADALTWLGWADATVVETQMSWAESAVRFLTDPVVAQILLAVGFLGLLAEAMSPGWGVPGSVGVAALALFFGSRLVVGLLGFEAILLFALGLLLLVVEALVVPGFGLPGVLGLGALGASLFLSFPDPRSALQAMAITALSVVVLALLFLRRFQKSSLWGRLILTQQQADAEYRPVQHVPQIVGREGVTHTPLRPSGTIEVDGEYYDAISEGAMIPKGETIRVLKVEGARIVVRRVTGSRE